MPNVEVKNREILTIDDVKLLVDEFYAKVQKDDVLADIFNTVIQDRWGEHLAKMYTFWQTILLGEHTYYGSPFKPHATLPLDITHFNRWISLFHQTVNSNFEGEKAEEAKWRAEKMAEMFRFKIEHYRDNPTQHPL